MNNESKSDYSLKDDGIDIVYDFFSAKELEIINTELDKIFSDANFSINGRISYFTPRLLRKTIPSASISIFTINILEKIIDSALLVKKSLGSTNQDLIATSVEIWQDEKSSKELFWHTDNRDGMIRCLIYLEGGSKTSGAFKYMLGTHKRTWYCEHNLTNQQVESMSDLIFIADKPPGSMVMSDTLGFHANSPKAKRRRVMMIEFQPRICIDYPRSNIYLASRDLSQKVIQNIELFVHSPEKSNHGADLYFFNNSKNPKNPIFIKLYFLYLKAIKIKSKLSAIIKK